MDQNTVWQIEINLNVENASKNIENNTNTEKLKVFH